MPFGRWWMGWTINRGTGRHSLAGLAGLALAAMATAWLAACSPPDTTATTDPPTDGATVSSATTAATGDTSATPEPLGPIGTECDPVIRVPGDDTALTDPHAEVYGPGASPAMVHLGWPSNDPSVSVSFLWRTDLATRATAVEFGSDGTLDQRVEGVSFTFGTDDAYRIHEIRLCDGLQPGTTYRYRVGGDGAWSDMYTFSTPAPPGTFDTFRFAFVGDSRGAYEDWSQVIHAADAYAPDFVVFTGDAVGFGGNQDEWDGWYRALGTVATRIPIISAHGNHEGLSENYFAQVGLPGNEQWFTIKYGNLHLVVLNDTPASFTEDLDFQADYIDRSFAEAVPGAVGVAAHHQGIYATCTTHRSNESLRADWAPKYDANHVRMVLNGHNHIYERSVPIHEGVEVQPLAGTTYVTSGGAGATLYPGFDGTEWFGAVANPVHHYGIVDFSPGQIDVVVRDMTGNVIDAFTR